MQSGERGLLTAVFTDEQLQNAAEKAVNESVKTRLSRSKTDIERIRERESSGNPFV